MGKNIAILGLYDIRIEKNGNRLFASINLNDLQYSENGTIELADKLKRLHEKGFTKFETTYVTGYYNSVEEIGLEFIREIKEGENF